MKAQNSQALKMMLINEIGLKKQIIGEVTDLILQDQLSTQKITECKFLLQLWIFNPYVDDQLLDKTLKLISYI